MKKSVLFMILSWLCLGSSMAQFRSLEPLTDVSDRSYYLNGLQFLRDEIYSFSPEGVSVSKNEGITWDALSFDPKGRYPIELNMKILEWWAKAKFWCKGLHRLSIRFMDKKLEILLLVWT